MKITIHIGSTKTGSSALQMHLAQAREKLLDAGILYPEFGTKSNAHHVLFAAAHPGAWGMHRDALSSNEVERFAFFRNTFECILEHAESAGVDHIVLSSEYWWGLLPEKFQKLISDNLQHHDVRLVGCVRRQDRWLEASYLQAVKGGESKSFEFWLRNKLRTPVMGGAHYLKILNHWNEILLPLETIVIPYEFSDRTAYIKKVSNSVCDKDVGSLTVPSEAKVVNKSPNAEGVEAILKLNKGDEIEARRIERMYEIMGSYSRPENTATATLMTELDQRRLLKRFRAINKVTECLYFNGNELFKDIKNIDHKELESAS